MGTSVEILSQLILVAVNSAAANYLLNVLGFFSLGVYTRV